MTSLPADIVSKVREVNQGDYKSQAIFYLNAFWADKKPAEAEAETVWELVQAFSKEDHVKGKNGNELNPIQAFNVLQKRNQTLTALELKAQLRKVDIDANGEMALAEYLLFINDRDPVAFATNPQGSCPPELLAEAQAKLDQVSKAFEELQAKEAAAKQAEIDAKNASIAAEKTEQEVKQLTADAKVLDAEIKKQEEAKEALIARLEATSTDQTIGIVKRNMAVQELAQAKNEDPLPLRKAKLDQAACVRRLEKASAQAEINTQKSKDTAVAATEAVAQVQVAIKNCLKELDEAENQLKKLQASGDAMGLNWYLSRELQEKKKSLPTRMW
jgi:hypothetical protein